jgi:hypothetical protein
MREDCQCDRIILDVLTELIKFVVVDGSIYVEFNMIHYNGMNLKNNNLLIASVLEHAERLTLKVVK